MGVKIGLDAVRAGPYIVPMTTYRNVRLELRLTAAERDKLESLAAKAGMTLTAYLLTRAGVRSAKEEK